MFIRNRQVQLSPLVTIFRSKERLILAAVLVWVAIACYWFSSEYYFRVCDDAYISFRYARNWVDGFGLVFNKGEYVEGYTNFLWVAVLGLIHICARLIDASPVRAAIAVSVLISLVNILLLYRISLSIFDRRRVLAVIPPLLLGVDNTFLVNSVMGLEGPVLMMWFLLGVMLLEKDLTKRSNQIYLGLLCAALVMTRPDAVLMAVVLMGVYLASNRDRNGGPRVPAPSRVEGSWPSKVFVPLLTFALPVGLWLIWKLYYYGNLLPNTYYLKLDTRGFETLALALQYVNRFLMDTLYLPVLIIPAFFLSSNRLVKVLCAASFVQVLYVLYVGGDFYPFSRFLLITLPGTFVAVVVMIDYVLNRRPTLLIADRFLLAIPLVAAVLIAVYGINEGPYRREIVPFGRLHEGRARLGQWLKTVRMPGDAILFKAIGSIGYYSGIRIIDVFGVIDPEVAKTRKPTVGHAGHEKQMRLEEALKKAPTIVPWATFRKEVKDWRPYGFFLFTDLPRRVRRFEKELGPGVWFKDDLPKTPIAGSQVFDFEGSLEGWKIESESEGVKRQPVFDNTGQKINGMFYQGHGYLSTLDPVMGDKAKVTMISPKFRLLGDRMCLLVAGGRNREKLRVELKVGDEAVFKTTGSNTDFFGRQCFDVSKWKGWKGRLRVVDGSERGHVMVDWVGEY